MKLILMTCLITISASAALAAAPTYNCEAEKWLNEPVITEGHFDGTLTARCAISDAAGGGIGAVSDYFTRKARAATHLDAGPTPETSEGLPATAYEITDSLDALTIVSTLHIASDRQTRAIMANISKEVRGSGSAGLTKKLDVTVDVTKLSEDGKYQVVLTTRVQVKKPAMIPARGFMGAAKNIAKGQFQKRRDESLPQIMRSL